MAPLASSQTRSINRYFLEMLIPIVLLVSISISALFAFNDFQTNKASRLDSQRLIFETFAAVIRQPLIQGSLIEARIRAEALANHLQIECIEITSPSETINTCHKGKTGLGAGLNRMDTDLYFSEDKSNLMGHLTIIFDNSDLVTNTWKNLGKNVVGFVLMTLALFLVLSVGFSRIKKELNELMKILASPGDASNKTPVFRISEFLSLGKNLSHQFEISKAAAEAKAALDVARYVAHDIRSPIVSLQMALHAAQNQLDPQTKSALNSSAQRISDIANDVLTNHTPANRISEARPPIQQLPMSVSLALKEMIDEKTLLCKETSNVTVVADLSNSDTLVEMRISDFKRVISNLVDNAIQAMPGGGKIQVGYTRIGNECCISIIDNGIGMSPEVLKDILEKGGSYEKPGGKGLGFQWAKRKVEQGDGRILMSSTKGIGTEVKIILPAFADSTKKISSEVRLGLAVKEA